MTTKKKTIQIKYVRSVICTPKKHKAVVKGLVGDYRPHRAWLREHGAELHAFGGGG